MLGHTIGETAATGSAASILLRLINLADPVQTMLMVEVEVRIKKYVKRNGKREDVGELAIAFGSMDELNGLIERLRGGK